jgi:hypothetical protein
MHLMTIKPEMTAMVATAAETTSRMIWTFGQNGLDLHCTAEASASPSKMTGVTLLVDRRLCLGLRTINLLTRALVSTVAAAVSEPGGRMVLKAGMGTEEPAAVGVSLAVQGRGWI